MSAKHLGAFTVPAELTVTSGMIEIDADHQVTAVVVTVDAASYASKNDKRNEHIVSADFLDSANHPTITFRARGVTSGADGYVAGGTLTVKGTAAPIHVVISNIAVDGDRATFVATATVDRHDIGIDKFPAFVVGKDLELHVHATAASAT